MAFNDKQFKKGKIGSVELTGKTLKDLFNAGEFGVLDWMRTRELKKDMSEPLKNWTLQRNKYIGELLEMAPKDDGQEVGWDDEENTPKEEFGISGTTKIISLKRSLNKIKEAITEMESWL